MADFPVVIAENGFPVRITNNIPGAIVTPSDIPTDLGWNYPMTFSLIDNTGVSAYGLPSETPEVTFNRFSTAYSNPGATFYVSLAGSNANDGLTSGTAVFSIHNAIAKANATGLPSKIFVSNGNYNRANNITNGTATMPTVDIALVATGGRVVTGVWDDFTTPSLDGTYTNTYAITIGAVDRVVDRKNLDEDGNYTDLILVSTPTRCNITPNSYAYSGGILYINRIDGDPVTTTNIRVYRTSSGTIKVESNINLYMGGLDGAGFDLEGGNGAGCISIAKLTIPTLEKAVVVNNCTFKYGGGTIQTGVSGVSIANNHGLAYFYNCYAAKNTTDSFNCHNYLGSSLHSTFLTVNCTGLRTGGKQQSCNNWTIHEDVIGIDVAGTYKYSNGGNIRNIDNSKCFLIGTYVERDLGDVQAGGTVRPTGIKMDNNAIAYCFRTKVIMNSGEYGYQATSGAAIYQKEIWPTSASNSGNIQSY